MKKVAKVLGIGAPAKAPKITLPEPEKPTPIPDEEDVKRRAMMAEAMRKRTGRASTILTDDGDYLG